MRLEGQNTMSVITENDIEKSAIETAVAHRLSNRDLATRCKLYDPDGEFSRERAYVWERAGQLIEDSAVEVSRHTYALQQRYGITWHHKPEDPDSAEVYRKRFRQRFSPPVDLEWMRSVAMRGGFVVGRNISVPLFAAAAIESCVSENALISRAVRKASRDVVKNSPSSASFGA